MKPRKRVPRAAPQTWHLLSVANWNAFGESSFESRKRYKKFVEKRAAPKNAV